MKEIGWGGAAYVYISNDEQRLAGPIDHRSGINPHIGPTVPTTKRPRDRSPKIDLFGNDASACVDLVDVVRFVGDKDNVVAIDETWYDQRLRVDLIPQRHRKGNSKSADRRRGQD